MTIQLTATDFQAPVDICNRALDIVGQEHIAAMTTPNVAGRLLNFLYNKERQAELQRNDWLFAIKRVALRPISTGTMQFQPPAYNAATTYLSGAIVSLSGVLYVTNVNNSLASTPGTAGSDWSQYFGALTVNVYDSSQTYFAGELVYTTPDDGTYKVYTARVNVEGGSSTEYPGSVDVYDSTLTYQLNDIVSSGTLNYISLTNLNLNQTPASSPSKWAVTALSNSSQWVLLSGATLTSMNFVYPIGGGPMEQAQTLNVYQKPYGYLKKANQAPKVGQYSYLGAPSGPVLLDWIFEGDYFMTSSTGVIIIRFVADLVDVTAMTPMFCEGLAAKIAIASCEKLTQSKDKISTATTLYRLAISDARMNNAIEKGSDEMPVDDYLVCRL